MTTLPGLSGSKSNSLQSTIAAASATSQNTIQPHHPISCPDEIFYDEDGSLRCNHATAPPDDVRSQHCVVHSIAILLIELGSSL